LKKLRLSSNDLKEAALPALPALEDLTLSYQNLKAWPTGLEGMPRLTSLVLSGAFANKTTVTIPELLSSLPLTSLSIVGPKVVGLDVLGRCASLKKVSLGGIENRDLKGLEHNSTIEDLNLDGCEVSDFSALSSMTALTNLNLESCDKLKDISFLDGMTALKTINLDYAPAAAVAKLCAPPYVDRLQMTRDPDEDDEDVSDERQKFWAAQAMRTVPEPDVIKAHLAEASTPTQAAEAVREAVVWSGAMTTDRRRVFGIEFGNDIEPPAKAKKRRRDDDDDDEDEDEDEAPKKSKKKAPPAAAAPAAPVAKPPTVVEVPEIERCLVLAGGAVSDEVLLKLFRLAYRKSNDRYVVAATAARMLVQRPSSHLALAQAITRAYDEDWTRRPRKGIAADIIVEEVMPQLNCAALEHIFSATSNDQWPEKGGDGLLAKVLPRAFVDATEQQLSSIVTEVERLLQHNRDQLDQPTLRTLFDDIEAAAPSQSTWVQAMRRRHLPWFDVHANLTAAIASKSKSKGKGKGKGAAPADTVDTTAALQILNAVGSDGGLDTAGVDDHAESLLALLENKSVPMSAFEPTLQVIYSSAAVSRQTRNLGRQILEGLLAQGDVSDLREALGQVVEQSPAKNAPLIEALD
jgi:hypothetical protein